jgi:hypothetical protein
VLPGPDSGRAEGTPIVVDGLAFGVLPELAADCVDHR